MGLLCCLGMSGTKEERRAGERVAAIGRGRGGEEEGEEKGMVGERPLDTGYEVDDSGDEQDAEQDAYEDGDPAELINSLFLEEGSAGGGPPDGSTLSSDELTPDEGDPDGDE